MKYRFHAISLLSLLFLSGFALAQKDSLKDGHPAWIMQGNIYEVNVRQYTPEGTFKAFEKSLDRLKNMGVQTLWFMPINPISQVDRKGVLGSYYAVYDYTKINPEFGGLNDWKHLVNAAHSKGFKVLIDWVPNHTGGDHYWLTTHPDFFVKDSTGKPKIEFDWTDTRKLNYANPEMVDSMIADMKYWLTETDIDGFRCDHADGPTLAFWQKCNAELKQTALTDPKHKRNIFMLAEVDAPEYITAGFDAIYPWDVFHIMNDIAAGNKNALALDSIVKHDDSIFPAHTIQLYFTSNHDENSWNKADYATMPGAVHAPFAVLTQTLEHSIPLVYSGQEEPFLDSISFFYKDTITFSKFERAPFYKTLLTLRKNNRALDADASFTKLSTSKNEVVYAFVRQNNNQKVMVLTNLSSQPQTFTINYSMPPVMQDVFANKMDEIHKNEKITLPAWGYKVYLY